MHGGPGQSPRGALPTTVGAERGRAGAGPAAGAVSDRRAFAALTWPRQTRAGVAARPRQEPGVGGGWAGCHPDTPANGGQGGWRPRGSREPRRSTLPWGQTGSSSVGQCTHKGSPPAQCARHLTGRCGPHGAEVTGPPRPHPAGPRPHPTSRPCPSPAALGLGTHAPGSHSGLVPPGTGRVNLGGPRPLWPVPSPAEKRRL